MVRDFFVSFKSGCSLFAVKLVVCYMPLSLVLRDAQNPLFKGFLCPFHVVSLWEIWGTIGPVVPKIVPQGTMLF